MVEEIKRIVSIVDVCNMYGFKINRNGFIICPFHKDKRPSMKIYEKTSTFYCFVCNEYGDIISFVKKLFNIDFKTALAKINEDFNLGINLYSKVDKKALKRIYEARKKEKERIMKLNYKYHILSNAYRKFYKMSLKLEKDLSTENWEGKAKALSICQNECEKIDVKLKYIEEML